MMNKSKDLSRRSFLQSVVGVFAVSSTSLMALVSSGCSPETGSSSGDSDAVRTMDSDASDQSGRSALSDSDQLQESSSDSDASDQSGRSAMTESDSSDSDQNVQEASSDSDQSDQSGRSAMTESDSSDSDQSDQSGREMSDSDQATAAPSSEGEGVDSDASGRR